MAASAARATARAATTRGTTATAKAETTAEVAAGPGAPNGAGAGAAMFAKRTPKNVAAAAAVVVERAASGGAGTVARGMREEEAESVGVSVDEAGNFRGIEDSAIAEETGLEEGAKGTGRSATPQKEGAKDGFVKSDFNAGALNLFLGLRWRVLLGALYQKSITLDELRRMIAGKRRKYGSLRRELLVNPHNSNKQSKNSSDLSVDNPLSQDPGSCWTQYFNVHTVMKAIEADLDALTSESEQSPIALDYWKPSIKRILAIWSLSHPHVGYCKGMLEILFPLLHVLQKDIERFVNTRLSRSYGDIFDDDFNTPSAIWHNSFHDYDGMFSSIQRDVEDLFDRDDLGRHSLLSLPSEFSTEEFLVIASGCDPYGAEGDLGALLSMKYLEHDAYCLFDSLLKTPLICKVTISQMFQGLRFSRGFEDIPSSSIPAVCSSVYSLLKRSDPLLHDHLTHLGLESQLFALRWMSLLFSREFQLPDLIQLWNEMFSEGRNNFLSKLEPRMVLMVEAVAVALLKRVRSSLLSCNDFTGCLERLLRLPPELDMRQVLKVAREVYHSLHSTSSPSSSPSPSSPPIVRNSLSSVRKELFPKHLVLESENTVPVRDKLANGPNESVDLRSNESGTPSPFQISVNENSWEEAWNNSLHVQGVRSTLQHSNKKFSFVKQVTGSIPLENCQISSSKTVYPQDLRLDPSTHSPLDPSPANFSGYVKDDRSFLSENHRVESKDVYSFKHGTHLASRSFPSSPSSSSSNEDVFTTAMRWKRKLWESSSMNVSEYSEFPPNVSEHYCSNCIRNQTFTKQRTVSVRTLKCNSTLSSTKRRGWTEEKHSTSTLKEDELEILVSERSSMHARSISMHVRVDSILGDKSPSKSHLPGLGFEDDYDDGADETSDDTSVSSLEHV